MKKANYNIRLEDSQMLLFFFWFCFARIIYISVIARIHCAPDPLENHTEDFLDLLFVNDQLRHYCIASYILVYILVRIKDRYFIGSELSEELRSAWVLSCLIFAPFALIEYLLILFCKLIVEGFNCLDLKIKEMTNE